MAHTITEGHARGDAEDWTAALNEGQILRFKTTVDQGEYLLIEAEETGTVIQISRVAPAFIVIRMRAPHWQLGEGNLLCADAYCTDILDSLRADLAINSNVVNLSDGLAFLNTA